MHLLGLFSQGHSNGVIALRRCCCAKGFGEQQRNLLIYQTAESEGLILAVGFSNIADLS